jgi:hypothetical protein
LKSKEHYVDLVKAFGTMVTDIPNRYLLAATQNERARVLGPLKYQGRTLYFLDMSSGCPTGTFKDWIACVTVAHCLAEGIQEFVAQTSGNTGNALASYAARLNIRPTILYPKASRYKIDPTCAESPLCRFLEFQGTEPDQKILTAKLAQITSQPWLPDWSLQISANKLRAHFLEYWCSKFSVQFDWHAQALSSAFGVFGFYRGLEDLNCSRQPKLLGVQQVFRDPFAGGTADLSQPLLEPTLFRSGPSEKMRAEMASINEQAGSRFVTMNSQTYHERLAHARDVLAQVGLDIKTSFSGDDIHEKSPILGLIGVLSGIERGWIESGETVCVAVTGGVGRVPSKEFTPDVVIPSDYRPWLERVGTFS